MPAADTLAAPTALIVARREVLASEVVALTLVRADGAELRPWHPGAHIELSMPTGGGRQYSLCGDPADSGVYQIAVQLDRQSRGGSQWVWDALHPGCEVLTAAPRNDFALVSAPRYLFLAGGIGITPMVAMLSAADAAGADWQLVYGGRNLTSMAFAAELRSRYSDRVTLVPQDELGLLDLSTLLRTPDPACAVYACGPEPMLAAAEAATGPWPAGALHVERFAAAAGANRGAEFSVRLTDGREVTVAEDQSILQALRDAGIAVDSSCESGTCGTCETTVRGGEPEHRDEFLTDDERAANETMMVCVSRARTAVLELDL